MTAKIIVLNERAYPSSATRQERLIVDCERAEHSIRSDLDFLLSKGAYSTVRQIIQDYTSVSSIGVK